MSDSSSDDTPLTREEERELDMMIEQALKAAERGMDPEAALASVLDFLPAHLKQKVRQKFTAKLEEKKAKARAQQAQPPAKAAVGLKQMLALVAQKTLDKIAALLKSRPDIQRRVIEAGNALLRNGVAVDMVRLTDADLGNLSPSAGVAQSQTQETGR